MKKITVILSVLLCILILCSCGRGGEDTETTLTTEATTEETTTETTTEQVTTTEPVTQSESEKALGEFRKLMKDENYLCGVAYLGYYSEDIGVIIEDLQYKGIYKKHKFFYKTTSESGFWQDLRLFQTLFCISLSKGKKFFC